MFIAHLIWTLLNFIVKTCKKKVEIADVYIYIHTHTYLSIYRTAAKLKLEKIYFDVQILQKVCLLKGKTVYNFRINFAFN